MYRLSTYHFYVLGPFRAAGVVCCVQAGWCSESGVARRFTGHFRVIQQFSVRLHSIQRALISIEHALNCAGFVVLLPQVLDDVPGIGRVAKAAPEYDGPTFGVLPRPTHLSRVRFHRIP